MKKFVTTALTIAIFLSFYTLIDASVKGSPKSSSSASGNLSDVGAKESKGSMMHKETSENGWEAGYDEGYNEGTITNQAVVVLKGTEEGSEISGEIIFWEIEDGVIVEAEVWNVPNPGKHGFHIHDKKSCDNGGKAAGGHFNPEGVPHGLLKRDGSQHAHLGDMGNIMIEDDGYGTFDDFLPGVFLSGDKNNVSGRAVILHADEDDFGQPTGNAGGRIGCGLIQVINE